MGIVYVITNAAMPGLVKIGMTDDNDSRTRIAQLYSTGVPLPFDVHYACRVDNPDEVEQALHIAFGPQRINPKREFFRIDMEQAIAVLRLLHKPDATSELVKQANEVDPVSRDAAEKERSRRPNFNFGEMKIPPGSVLQAYDDSDVTITVVDDRRVRLGDEELSLSAATRKAFSLDYAVRPGSFWRYNGRSISDIYDETYRDW